MKNIYLYVKAKVDSRFFFSEIKYLHLNMCCGYAGWHSIAIGRDDTFFAIVFDLVKSEIVV